MRNKGFLFSFFAVILAMLFAPDIHAESIRTVTAGGALTAGARVNASGIVAGITDEDIGTSLAAYASGQPAAIIMDYDGSFATYLASGAIAAGADVYPDTLGNVTATVQGKRIGKALTSSTNLGDSIRVFKLAPANDRVIITKTYNASSVADWAFIADRAYTVVSVKEVHSVVGGAAAALAVRKVTDTSAPGASASGTVTECLATTFDLTAAINTTVSKGLSATPANLNLAANDKLGVNLTGTLTGLAGCVVVIELKPK